MEQTRVVEIKKKTIAITSLAIILTGLGISLIDLDCSTFQLTEQEKDIIENFDVETFEELDQETQERVYSYLKSCKEVPIMMSVPNVVVE